MLRFAGALRPSAHVPSLQSAQANQEVALHTVSAQLEVKEIKELNRFSINPSLCFVNNVEAPTHEGLMAVIPRCVGRRDKVFTENIAKVFLRFIKTMNVMSVYQGRG